MAPSERTRFVIKTGNKWVKNDNRYPSRVPLTNEICDSRLFTRKKNAERYIKTLNKQNMYEIIEVSVIIKNKQPSSKEK